MDRNIQAVQQGIAVSGVDAAHANEYFEQFVNASTLKNIFGYYRGLIDCLHLRPNVFNLFYPKLKANLTSWRAKALLKKFDCRASHKCYQKGKVAANTKVLVIGGGPCGLRTAIEAQLLGAKVVVIEKRDRFSRNNVLHLWPFVIEDLRMLGAKKFFGKFCAGAIDHISIRQLQCILLKVALLLGVEIHTEVSFETLIEPSSTEKIGWRAQFKPSNHPVSQYEFDVVIGADGKRNTLQGFSRKEFRGKLAIAITANFINKRTEAEARVEEISGVAFIFNQKFFKDLQEVTRIDLENIVYYKDDTHYFVMTAKKHSLIEKGVIKQDFSDTEKLLAPENVDKEALQQYAIEAASFSTNYQMANLEFAVNHYGQPDIAMFDFTSMYAAENASKVVERSGYRLLKILVGDSLLEPFWPTGSGCARGFLSALDAAWAIRTWAIGIVSPLDVMAEREAIYRLLAQTTPDNLNKDWKSYTLDPVTRYPNLNRATVMPHQVLNLFDTDNPANIDRLKRVTNERPTEIPKKRKRGGVDNEVLLNWLSEQCKEKDDINVTDLGLMFKDGKVLCAIIHHYRPDLLDYSAILSLDPAKRNQIAIDILEKDLGVPPVMTGSELTITEDYLTMASYLTEVYHCFRGEIPHVKHQKLRSPPKLTPLSKNQQKTCKKCSNSKSSNGHLEKKPVVLTQINFSVVDVTESDTCRQATGKRINKNVEIVYKKFEEGAKIKTPRRKKVETKSSRNNQDRRRVINETPDKMNDNTCVKVEDARLNFVEKMYHKNEELRQVLTQLIVRRKSSLKKGSLSSIPEVKCETIEVKPNDTNFKLQSHHNVSVIDIHPRYDLLRRNSVDKSVATEIELPFLTNSTKRDHIDTYCTQLCRGDCVPQTKPSSRVSLHRPRSERIKIRVLERKTRTRFTLQTIDYLSALNHLTVSSKIALNCPFNSDRPDLMKMDENNVFDAPRISSPRTDVRDLADDPSDRRQCQTKLKNKKNFSSKTMIDGDGIPNQIYSRVSNWISSNDFFSQENNKADTDVDTVVSNSKITDITSVSKMDQYNGIVVEERTDVINFTNTKSGKMSEENGSDKTKASSNRSIKNLTKFSHYSPFQQTGNLKSLSAPPKQFSVIIEGEETSELPVGTARNSELSFKTIKTAAASPAALQLNRPTSRHKHKHHIDVGTVKSGSVDRKPRKRRTLEKLGANMMFNIFFNGFVEAGLVGIVLFMLDIVINSEQYGFQNYLFNS